MIIRTCRGWRGHRRKIAIVMIVIVPEIILRKKGLGSDL
jgi:hypothetical protein